jgi:hypothetical protein
LTDVRRFHLFEWEDQPWLPVVFRDFITDHLRYFLTQGLRRPVNRQLAEKLRPLVMRAGNRIVDLCAGAGGPLLAVQRILSEELHTPVEVLLTDLYPNVTAFEQREAEGRGAIKARYESTSAFDVPPDLRGLRTLFTALHHFKPANAQTLLADAARKGQPIAVFEPLERTPRMLLLMFLYGTWQSFVLTPAVGPLTLRRFLLTYVLPIAPAIMAWDGFVSVLRSYTPDELRALTEGIGISGYQWEAGRFDVPGPFGILMPTIYLLGGPADDAPQSVPEDVPASLRASAPPLDLSGTNNWTRSSRGSK